MNNDDQYNQIITSLKSAIPENAPSHLAEKACLVGLQALKADNHKHIFTRIALPLAVCIPNPDQRMDFYNASQTRFKVPGRLRRLLEFCRVRCCKQPSQQFHMRSYLTFMANLC